MTGPAPSSLPHRVRLDSGISLELTIALPSAQPRGTVLMLHGFPDIPLTFHRQIPALTAAGHRVLAPAQRGYASSDKPPGVPNYDLDLLAADMAALLRATDTPTAAIVGHDWGGIVAYWAAATYPRLFTRVIILNAPHPAVLRPYLLRHPGQLLRSLYAAFFQLPGIPEALLARRNFALLERGMKRSARIDAFSPDEWPRYRDAWSQPGALTAMINYYRALFRRPQASLRRRVEQPTLVLWGKKDRFEQLGLAHASLKHCTYGRLRVFDTATHWAHREEWSALNTVLLRFLEDPRMVTPQGQ